MPSVVIRKSEATRANKTLDTLIQRCTMSPINKRQGNNSKEQVNEWACRTKAGSGYIGTFKLL
nr:MAG TPA: hypothetical protein [Caudoviricetes sp.]